MSDLYPVFEVENDEIDNELEAEVYKSSVFFDLKEGDFSKSAKGIMSVESTGKDAWYQWCIKVCNTQKGSCLAYNEDFGIDYDGIFSGYGNEGTQFGRLKSEIFEALMSDPRTESVSNFEFKKTADELRIKFDVANVEGESDSVVLSV